MGCRFIPTGETGELDLFLLPSGEAVRARWERFRVEHDPGSWGEPQAVGWTLWYQGGRLAVRDRKAGLDRDTLLDFPERWAKKPDSPIRLTETVPHRYGAKFDTYHAAVVGSALLHWTIELDLAERAVSYEIDMDIDTDP